MGKLFNPHPTTTNAQLQWQSNQKTHTWDMNLLRGKSSERGNVVSESERQCGVRVMGEWEWEGVMGEWGSEAECFGFFE